VEPPPARLAETAVPVLTETPHHRLERLFQPRTVCIVGASDRPDSLGRYALRNLVEGGFAGRIDLVNPRHEEVLGRPCRQRIADLDGPSDVAMLAIPDHAVAGSLQELAALGTRHAVMLATLNLPAAGREQLDRTLRGTGIRLVGPRSLGLARPDDRLNLTVARPAMTAGSLAVVSQSAAVCAALLDFAEGSGIGVSSVVAVGGEIDIDVADALDYLGTDPATRSIAVYLDGVRNARRLLSTLRAAARSKPVIVLKSGQNDIGTRALVTHTDMLVSDHETFRSALRRCGAVSVDSFGELFSAVEWLEDGRRVRGDRLAIVTNGGGLGALAADACRRYRVELAKLSDRTIQALAADLPAGWSGGNPVNVTPVAPAGRIAATVVAVADDPQADGVLALFHPTQAADSASMARALLAEAPGLPTMYGFVGEADAKHGSATMNRSGHSVFNTPEDAVRAFSILVEYQRGQRNLLQAPSTRRTARLFDESAIEDVIRAALAAGCEQLDEVRSKHLLAACGVPVPRTVLARTTEEAVDLAARMGYPVVIKIVSPDVTHKSDVGGVRLDIRDELELRAAASAIRERLHHAAPAARLDGFALQPMVSRGRAIELLVGVSRDRAFGPVITFGAGGVSVELIADTATALPPLNSLLAHDLISRTRVVRLLSDQRQLPPESLDAIADVLVSVSTLVCRFPAIRSMDINPLLASAGGALALDARIVLDVANPQRDSRYRHLAIHPYPSEMETTVSLGTRAPPALPGTASGEPGDATETGTPVVTRVLLRPIQPDDAPIGVAFFDRLSPQTRQWRFLHPIKVLSAAMIARFTQVDYDRDMALVALPVADDGLIEQRIIGVARYMREVDDSRCEFAIVVDDEWQGQGLARAMMTHLISHARTVGLTTMVGYVHLENRRMLAFIRSMGFRLSDSSEDPSLRIATLALGSAP
jgi:acetyltransferase